MKKLYYSAFVYVVLGLAFGVVYRELTKHYDFEGYTQLSVLHTHALMLGMTFFLTALVLERLFSLTKGRSFFPWFLLYHVSLGGLLVTMLIRGIGQVVSWELTGFNHVAGLFHVLISIAFIWFFIILGGKIRFQSKPDL